MSKFIFNGEIKGYGHHFGDNYFGSSNEFVEGSNRKFSSAEKELIELIFENFQSEEDKKNLLVSLKSLSEIPERNISEVPVWRKFINHLTDHGFKEVAERVIGFAKDRIPHLIIES